MFTFFSVNANSPVTQSNRYVVRLFIRCTIALLTSFNFLRAIYRRRIRRLDSSRLRIQYAMLTELRSRRYWAFPNVVGRVGCLRWAAGRTKNELRQIAKILTIRPPLEENSGLALFDCCYVNPRSSRQWFLQTPHRCVIERYLRLDNEVVFVLIAWNRRVKVDWWRL